MSDSVPFTRTSTGLIGSWQFHSIPTIWVEGHTDVLFYEPILHDLNCRIQPFHGIENARALINNLSINNSPYVVICDGDYSILSKGQKQPHKKVVILEKYSFENYLWDKGVLNRACLRHAQSGEKSDTIGNEFDRLCNHFKDSLFELVVLDIAARQINPAPKVLPDRIEAILSQEEHFAIDDAKTKIIANKAKSLIDSRIVEMAKQDLEKFTITAKFSDIIRGHFLFSVIRKLVCDTASKMRGKTISLGDEALTRSLTEMVWHNSPTEDHKRLKRKIRTLARSIQKAFPKYLLFEDVDGEIL